MNHVEFDVRILYLKVEMILLMARPRLTFIIQVSPHAKTWVTWPFFQPPNLFFFGHPKPRAGN